MFEAENHDAWARWLVAQIGEENALRVAALIRANRTLTDREEAILDLAGSGQDGEAEIEPNAIVSEGEDNGAYVEAWVWVSFDGTPLDKEPDAAAAA